MSNVVSIREQLVSKRLAALASKLSAQAAMARADVANHASMDNFYIPAKADFAIELNAKQIEREWTGDNC